MDQHYKFFFNRVKLDPYRIMQVYGITHPAQQHAVKKLLRAGRSIKSLSQDIDEVILTLTRWKEMIHEEEQLAAEERNRQYPSSKEEALERLAAEQERKRRNAGRKNRRRVSSRVESD